MTLSSVYTTPAPSQLSFSQYVGSLLQSAAGVTWPRRYKIIDELVKIYEDQRHRSEPGDTKIERALYALLTDRDQDAAVHQMILLTTARFTQIERGTAVDTAVDTFKILDIPAGAADRRTRALMARRSVRHDVTVHNLLPAAVALRQHAPELLRQTLVRWRARGGEVTQIARAVEAALVAKERRTAHGRSVRRLLGVLAWIAVLLAPLFLTMVICANLYTDHLLIFLRRTIY